MTSSRRLAVACVLVVGCGGAGVVAPTDAATVDASPVDVAALDRGAVDAPVDDAPVSDAPVLDAPLVDAPAADAPSTDAPAPLPAPASLRATAADGTVLLRWDPVPGAEGYVVRRGVDSGAATAVVGETVGTAFLDGAVTDGTTYFYVVAARRSGVDGVASAEVQATPTAPPDAPTNAQATGADAAVSITWSLGARAAQTRVRRATTAGGPYVDVGVAMASPFADSGLRDGTAYFYVLRSVNVAGESADSAEVAAMPIAPPADLVAVPGDAHVALFWSPSAGATGYDVSAASSAAGPFATLGRVTLPRFAETGVANGTSRWYRVVAVDPYGASAPSDVTTAPRADATPLPPPETPGANRVGLNVWFNNDWSGAAAFADVFKESRPWQDAADWHNPVGGVDALGWPTADASTVLMTASPAEMNGTYRLVFEGQGTVSLMWCPGSVDHAAYDPTTNTTTADVTFRATASGSVGLVFRDTRRTPTSPLHSGFARARLYRPGYPSDGSVTFTAPFLAALGRAQVLRTMDWTGGSSNLVVRWADRVTPLHATQAGLAAPTYTAADGSVWNSALGVALEHHIALCNRLLVDCWINIPPVADDDFVRNMALAIRFGTDGTRPYTAPQAHPAYAPLDPSLRLYLEYSNEVWNSAPGFTAFQLARAAAGHLPAGHPLLTPTPDGLYTIVWRYPAWRLATASETFRAVFGDAAMMTRVRPVLMTQAGNANNTLGAALSWLEAYAPTLPTPRTVREVIHGAGGSAYYGVNDALSALPDRFFATTNYPDAGALRAWGIDSLWAANEGVRHVAYEGGPGLSYSDADNRTLNADARMQAMMLATHDGWSAMGGDLVTYYTLRGPSQWEFTPDIHLATTPKLGALERLQASPRAAVTLGGALPGTLVARDLVTSMIRSGSGYDYTVDGLPCAAGFNTGNFVAYPGHASAAYHGTLRVNGYASADARLGVVINGVRAGEVTLPGASGTAHLRDSTALAVDVPAGVVAVRLEVLAGSMTLRSISL